MTIPGFEVFIEWRIQRSNDSGMWTVASRMMTASGRVVGFGPYVTFTHRADAQKFYRRVHDG